MSIICLSEVPKHAVELVSLDDPAFDQAALTPELRAEYEATQDHSALPLREGAEPIVVHCRPLDRPAADAALRAGLAKGGGAEIVLAYFERAATKVVATYKRTPTAPAKRGTLDRKHWARIPLEIRADIGAQIHALSHADDDAEPGEHLGK